MKGFETLFSKDGKLLAMGPLRYDSEEEYYLQFKQYTSKVGNAVTFVDPLHPDVFILVILEGDSE